MSSKWPNSENEEEDVCENNIIAECLSRNFYFFFYDMLIYPQAVFYVTLSLKWIGGCLISLNIHPHRAACSVRSRVTELLAQCEIKIHGAARSVRSRSTELLAQCEIKIHGAARSM